MDIVHPHTNVPENHQEQHGTVRQRQLPPYRPPQQMQPPRQAAPQTQGPIDASSNIIYPRTVPRYAQPPPPRQYQYPSDDDDWSVPPNEHVV